jgi:hypothetical protein
LLITLKPKTASQEALTNVAKKKGGIYQAGKKKETIDGNG